MENMIIGMVDLAALCELKAALFKVAAQAHKPEVAAVVAKAFDLEDVNAASVGGLGLRLAEIAHDLHVDIKF